MRGKGGEGGERRPLQEEDAGDAAACWSMEGEGKVLRSRRVWGERLGGWLSANRLLLFACLLLAFGGVESQSAPTVTFMNASANQTAWCAANSCLGPVSINLVVGQPVSFNVTAYLGPGRNASIAVLTDPGLPNGCAVSAEKYVNFTSAGDVATYRTLSFTPDAPQAGIVYSVCLRAYERTNGNNTATRCHTISVAAPVPSFDMNATTSPGMPMVVGVGCPVRMRLVATDAGMFGYCMTVVSGQVDGSLKVQVPPMGELLVGAVQAKAPLGTFDSCVRSEFELLWYPRKGQEAAEYHYCAYVKDTLCAGLACEQRAVTLCYHVQVAKCKYCLGVGETIMHAAARYQTDWLQLWGANTHIRNPDNIAAYSMLTLGPTYTVQRGDTLQGISTRFGASISAILEANTDIAIVKNTGVINPGDQICLLPWVCWDETYADAAGLRTPKIEF